MAEPTQSPFLEAKPKLQISLSWIFLVTIVAAATAGLTVSALMLPPVTAELYAWLGVNADAGNPAQTRRMQLGFLLLCYSAPLIVGLITRLLHLGAKRVAALMRAADGDDDDEFRMEPLRSE
ncbi:MAG: hypothetical protein U0892_23455 [Pirellulales bacterium]